MVNIETVTNKNDERSIIMAKRGDNIHKRKDGRWEGRYPKGRNDGGTIIYGSVYGRSYNETKEKLRMTVQNISKPQEIKTSEITFGYVLKEWMDSNRVRLKGGTVCKYQNLIEKHILPEFGNTKISEMSSSRINSYLNCKLTCKKEQKEGTLSASYVSEVAIDNYINSVIAEKYYVRNRQGKNNFHSIYLVTDTDEKTWAMKIGRKLNIRNDIFEKNAIIKEAYALRNFQHPVIPLMVELIENENGIYLY